MPMFAPVAAEVEAFASSQGMVIVLPEARISLLPTPIFEELFRPIGTAKVLPPGRPGRGATKARPAQPAKVAKTKQEGGRPSRLTDPEWDRAVELHRAGKGWAAIMDDLNLRGRITSEGLTAGVKKRRASRGAAAGSKHEPGPCYSCSVMRRKSPCEHCGAR